MKKITTEQLNRMLDAHENWLSGKKNGRQADFSGFDLSDRDLSGRNLKEAIFHQTVFQRTKFIGTDMSLVYMVGAIFDECFFVNTHIKGAAMRGCKFNNCYFYKVDLSWSDMSRGRLLRSQLNACKIMGTNLTSSVGDHTRIENSDVRKANFEDSRWKAASFINDNFTHANFRYAKLQDLRMVKVNASEANFSYAETHNLKVSNSAFMKACVRGSNLAKQVNAKPITTSPLMDMVESFSARRTRRKRK